jgi:fermentation-respiration switch protein FrsA (DUF1100 family)
MPASALEYSIERQKSENGIQDLTLVTEAGRIPCRLHEAEAGNAGIVWVFGAGGGLGGPAGGLYERLGRQLQPEGILSLQVAYRQPGRMSPCVEDTLTGIAFAASLGIRRLVLVGHSFGGAVAINAGVVSPGVVGVAALSSQTFGVTNVAHLSPKRLLLMHGEEDEILPAACSITLYRDAKEPKRLLLYPGCLHGLDQCRDAIDRDLTAWLLEVFEVG